MHSVQRVWRLVSVEKVTIVWCFSPASPQNGSVAEKNLHFLDHALVLIFNLLSVTGRDQSFTEIATCEGIGIEFIDGIQVTSILQDYIFN